MILSRSSPSSVERDFLDQKPKSPLFPGGGEAVVTNDYSALILIVDV